MKLLQIVILASLFAATAHASKARKEALGNVRAVTDIQTMFNNPVHILSESNFVTFESGATNANPGAEGGFIRSYREGQMKTGFYLGRKNTWVTDVRSPGTGSDGTTAAFQTEENPINLFWGTKLSQVDLAFNLNYSKSSKTTAGDQEAMGLALGAGQGPWQAALGLGLTNKATNAAGKKFEGKMPVIVDLSYKVDDVSVFFNYGMNGGTIKDTAGATETDLKRTDWSLALYKNQKLENGLFFYGFAYENRKWEDTKDNTNTVDNQEYTKLPVVMGIEAEASSWLTLRGSLKQNVILGESATGNATKGSIPNDTVVNAGAGIRYGAATFDAMLEGLSGATASGEANATELLSKVSLTYVF